MRGSRELLLVSGVSALVVLGVVAVGLIPFNRTPTPPLLDPASRLVLAQNGVSLAAPADRRIPELVSEANRRGVPAGLTQALATWAPATPGVGRDSAQGTVAIAQRGVSIPSTTFLAYVSSSSPVRARAGAAFISRLCNRAGSCVQGGATCSASGSGCAVGGRLAHRLCWVVIGDGVGPMAGRKTIYLVDAQSGQLLGGFQG